MTPMTSLRPAGTGCFMRCCFLPALLLCSLLRVSHAQSTSEQHFAYTVQQGDTLISLGERLLTYPPTWRELARLNRIAQPRRIPVGSVIRIPVRLLKSHPFSAPVIATTGDTRWTRASAGTVPVKAGDAVEVNDEIMTGGNGFATIRLADGSDIRIQPNSHVRLERAQHFEPAGFFKTRIKLLKGRVESLVKRSSVAPPSLEIQTPQATMGVRGTEFRAEAGNASHPVSAAEVLSGTVSANQITAIHAGYGVKVERAKPPQVMQLLPAPTFLPLAQQRQEREVLRLPVSDVPGARAYRLQLARDAQSVDMLTETLSNTADLRLTGVPDGRYVAKARGVDAHGLEGMEATLPVVVKAHPAPPMSMSPSWGAKARADSVTFEWTRNPQAATYRLQVAQQPNTSQPQTWDSPVVDALSVTDLQTRVSLPPGDYVWRMASVRADGDTGPWGDAQPFQLKALPPDMAPPKVTRTHVQVSWPGEPGQSFEVQTSRQPSFADDVRTQSVTTPFAAFERPEEGGRMYVRYRAIDPDGFVGPYAQTQEIELPACLKDSTGACLHTTFGQTISSGTPRP